MESVTTRPELLSLIETVSQEHGIHKYEITDVKTTEKGDGYLGEIFMVTVQDSVSGNTFSMTIKAAFKNEQVRQMIPIGASYQNEIYFYTLVFPIYQKLEENRGLKHVEMVPKCFKFVLEDMNEMLVLENLKVAGFTLLDTKIAMDDDHIKLCFETYGRLHAYSFALKDQKPEEYERLVKNFKNIYNLFMKNDFFAHHWIEIGKLVESTFVPEEDEVIMKKFEKYRGKGSFDIFFDTISAELDYSAILHGDCWSNNMLFKYENSADGRKPIDMRLIDFQVIRLGSPVCDLSYCLYTSVSEKDFKKVDEYLEVYYKNFSSFVKQLGSNPEKLFHFSALKEHWKKYSKFGMLMAFSMLKNKLTNKDDVVDLTDGISNSEELSEALKSAKFNETEYKKRVRGLIWHMHELDAL